MGGVSLEYLGKDSAQIRFKAHFPLNNKKYKSTLHIYMEIQFPRSQKIDRNHSLTVRQPMLIQRNGMERSFRTG